MYKLSQTKFWDNFQQTISARDSKYFAGITHSDELDAKMAKYDQFYCDNKITEERFDDIIAEYDKLYEMVLCGTIADLDEEGNIFDIDGEEIIDED